ncbi:MAG: sialidase family protein [Planctomycetota bacterium]
MLTFAFSLILLFQAQASRPATPESRPAPPVELKPFGDDNVGQPRLAVIPTPELIKTKNPHVFRRVDKTVLPKKLQIVGQRELEVVYTDSVDNGATFTNPLILMKVKEGAAMRRGPRIATRGKIIVVTAPEGGGKDERGILSVYSSDGGTTWSTPTKVTDQAGVAGVAFHDLTVTTGGVFVVTWLDSRNGVGKGQSVFLSRSTDGGKSWEKNVNIYSSPEGSVCGCCPIAMSAGCENRVGILFSNKQGAAHDLCYLLSGDAGSTFAPPLRIEGKISEPCPSAEGAIVFNNDVDDTGQYESTTCIINNRDGRLFARYSIANSLYARSYALTPGKQPTMAYENGLRYFAYVDATSEQLVLRFCPGDGDGRLCTVPTRLAGERVDSPMLALGPDQRAWITYEVRSGETVVSRLLDASQAAFASDTQK